MTYTIQHRPSPLPGPDGWSCVATVATEADAADELAYWPGPRLSHGDLVRVTGDFFEGSLWVFDADTSALVRAPKTPDGSRPRRRSWTALWESGETNAGNLVMIAEYGLATPHALHQRVVLAACAIVRTDLDHHRAVRKLQSQALETIERWARGLATEHAVEHAVASLGRPRTNRQQYVARAIGTLTTHPQAAIWSVLERVRDDDRVRDLAVIFRQYVPLSVVLCAALGLRDPLPLGAAPKPNRRRR